MAQIMSKKIDTQKVTLGPWVGEAKPLYTPYPERTPLSTNPTYILEGHFTCSRGCRSFTSTTNRLHN